LADEPYAPVNWSVIQDPAPDTLPDGQGGTNYLELVAERIDAEQGLAFALELSQPTSAVDLGATEFADLLGEHTWLTRWRGDISPEQMVLDPEFGAAPALGTYDNEHQVSLPALSTSRHSPSRAAWLVLPLVVGWWRTRKVVAVWRT
jgi:hypothetical protein